MKFLLHRLETLLSDIGYSNDVIQSIKFLSSVIHFQDIVKRLDVLKGRQKQGDFIDFLTAIKRVHNILSKTDLPPVEDRLLIEEAEKMLNDKIVNIKPSLQNLMEKQDYEAALGILFAATEPINLFFDRVLVMDKDEKVRLNRLSLLNEVWKTASSFADFSKLSIP
jgi:glycyl-tRNA synthetase beta chain